MIFHFSIWPNYICQTKNSIYVEFTIFMFVSLVFAIFIDCFKGSALDWVYPFLWS